MRRLIAIICGLILTGAVVAEQSGSDQNNTGFPLKIAKVNDLTRVHIKSTYQAGKKLTDKPAKLQIAKTIKFAGDPSYFLTVLGGERTIMVLDPNSKTLAIDLDCDSKITSKELFKGEPVEADANANPSSPKDALMFGPIYLQLWELKDPNIDPDTFGVNDINEVEGVWFYVKTHGDRFLAMYLARYWTGIIPCGNGRHEISLLDADFSGFIVPIKSKNEYKGDKIAIDLNNDGRYRREELFLLRSDMGIQNKLYRMYVKWDGSRIALQQFQQKFLVGSMPTFPQSINFGKSLVACRAGG